MQKTTWLIFLQSVIVVVHTDLPSRRAQLGLHSSQALDCILYRSSCLHFCLTHLHELWAISVSAQAVLYVRKGCSRVILILITMPMHTFRPCVGLDCLASWMIVWRGTRLTRGFDVHCQAISINISQKADSWKIFTLPTSHLFDCSHATNFQGKLICIEQSLPVYGHGKDKCHFYGNGRSSLNKQWEIVQTVWQYFRCLVHIIKHAKVALYGSSALKDMCNKLGRGSDLQFDCKRTFAEMNVPELTCALSWSQDKHLATTEVRVLFALSIALMALLLLYSSSCLRPLISSCSTYTSLRASITLPASLSIRNKLLGEVYSTLSCFIVYLSYHCLSTPTFALFWGLVSNYCQMQDIVATFLYHS